MDKWLKPALAYVPDWLDLQMRQSRQRASPAASSPSPTMAASCCSAFGPADLEANEPLAPRHRFRVASHSCKPGFESR
jgi:D-alanyl-D-alanine carboxypeptidase